MNPMAWMVVLLLAWSSQTRASVVGTAHETELADAGSACSACHIPHQAAGEKFWAQELVLEGKVGTISAMCASCHHSGEGYGALMTRAHSDDHVYGPNSHGQRMYLADPPPGTDAAGSGLPDVSPEHGYFECSTCHSVHDDTYRPFLRAEPNALCARCHRQRHFVNGAERTGAGAEAGRWGMATYTGLKNPGSHPVGEDVDGTRAGAPALVIPEIFRIPLFTAPGAWSLGGHLTSGEAGGVTCITCHSVHGVDPDRDAPALPVASKPPTQNYLTVEQSSTFLPGYPRPVANGNGASNTLCEACHGVGNNPSEDPFGEPWTTNTHNVSPGRSGNSSHPVDSYPSSVDALVEAFPEGWPVGDPALAGKNVGPVPICETCHTPHPAAALVADRGDVLPGAGPYLLRGSPTLENGEPLCDLCHTETVPGHHPVGKAYDSRGVPHLGNTVAGQGDILTCATCHSSAHDWREPGWASLDADWLPADNGRSADQATDMYHPDMSKTCMDCHYCMDGHCSSFDPSLGTAQTSIPTGDYEYTHYQTVDRGTGTHYIGLVHETGGKWAGTPLLNIYDTTLTWRDQAQNNLSGKALGAGWARFGGENREGSRVLVCESCHELDPARNNGNRHLLLAPYAEGNDGLDEFDGDADGRDLLCEVCHGVPDGTHPMTADMVTRTDQPLNAQASWIRDQLRGHATMHRAQHALSCDSCHQPHNANPNSYTFILDAPLALPNVSGPLGVPVKEGAVDAAEPSASTQFGYGVATGEPGSYATPTLQGRGGDHAGFCDQCHYYVTGK